MWKKDKKRKEHKEQLGAKARRKGSTLEENTHKSLAQIGKKTIDCPEREAKRREKKTAQPS